MGRALMVAEESCAHRARAAPSSRKRRPQRETPLRAPWSPLRPPELWKQACAQACPRALLEQHLCTRGRKWEVTLRAVGEMGPLHALSPVPGTSSLQGRRDAGESWQEKVRDQPGPRQPEEAGTLAAAGCSQAGGRRGEHRGGNPTGGQALKCSWGQGGGGGWGRGGAQQVPGAGRPWVKPRWSRP